MKANIVMASEKQVALIVKLMNQKSWWASDTNIINDFDGIGADALRRLTMRAASDIISRSLSFYGYGSNPNNLCEDDCYEFDDIMHAYAEQLRGDFEYVPVASVEIVGQSTETVWGACCDTVSGGHYKREIRFAR